MLDKDRAVSPSDGLDVGDDDTNVRGKGWELYEEETPDGKKYIKGKSRGKPMKNVVITSKNGPMSITIAIPREAFVDMVKKYFDIKGY